MPFLRMSKNPQTVKMQVSHSTAFASDVSVGDGFPVPQKNAENSLLRKAFCLTAQLEPYRTYVRRQARVACLWRFFNLCQSVKTQVFDRLRNGLCAVPICVFSQRHTGHSRKVSVCCLFLALWQYTTFQKAHIPPLRKANGTLLSGLPEYGMFPAGA